MKLKKETKSLIITLAILVLLTVIFWKPLVGVVSEPIKTRAFVSQFGFLAPTVFIILSFLQVVFAPLPGQLTGVAGGFVFGIWLGTLYSLIGITLGSLIVLILSRKFGRPFVEKHVDKRTLEKFDKIINKGGIPVIFMIFLLPFFQDDLILYIIGLTKIRLRTIMIITTMGRIPMIVVLSSIGAGISYSSPIIYLGVGAIILISIILFFNREAIERKISNKWR